MRVDLGKDRWAHVVDVDDMTHGTKMKVQALLPAEDSTEHFFVNELRMREALVAHVVTSWSLDLPVPNGDPAGLADVPGSVYDKLTEATDPHWRSLDFLRIGKTSSESRTDSPDTSSQDSSPASEQ
jgi:hypothetical protein